jgi:hypothetical protein
MGRSISIGCTRGVWTVATMGCVELGSRPGKERTRRRCGTSSSGRSAAYRASSACANGGRRSEASPRAATASQPNPKGRALLAPVADAKRPRRDALAFGQCWRAASAAASRDAQGIARRHQPRSTAKIAPAQPVGELGFDPRRVAGSSRLAWCRPARRRARRSPEALPR